MVERERTVKKRKVKRKKRKEREREQRRQASTTTNDNQDDLMTKLRLTTHDIQQVAPRTHGSSLGINTIFLDITQLAAKMMHRGADDTQTVTPWNL